MMRDLEVEKSGVIYADSSAALAIAKRKGAGKLRHINISCLWIQERQGSKELELRKGLGTENPADLMTKHLARQSLDKCMRQLNQHRAVGRTRAGLDVQGAKKSTTDKRPEAEPTSNPGVEVGDADGRAGLAAKSPSKDATPKAPVSPGSESAHRGAERQSTKPAQKRQAGKSGEIQSPNRDRTRTHLGSPQPARRPLGHPPKPNVDELRWLRSRRVKLPFSKVGDRDIRGTVPVTPVLVSPSAHWRVGPGGGHI